MRKSIDMTKTKAALAAYKAASDDWWRSHQKEPEGTETKAAWEKMNAARNSVGNEFFEATKAAGLAFAGASLDLIRAVVSHEASMATEERRERKRVETEKAFDAGTRPEAPRDAYVLRDGKYWMWGREGWHAAFTQADIDAYVDTQ